MPELLSRRLFSGLLAGSAVSTYAQRGKGSPSVDTHIHLFAADQKRFPFHPNAVYKPAPITVEDYSKFVQQAKIDHTIIVHPEPYQDDHRYLQYCFEKEPSKGFFKGTCLFDPIDPKTPGRMKQIVQEMPGRIVALRIHATAEPKNYPTKTGAIRDRDLRAPEMKATWKAAADLGLAIQMHMIPYYAPQLRLLASEFKNVPVIIDHLSRSGQGTKAEYDEVLRLAELPKVNMKFSGVSYSSRQEYPFLDVKPLVRRTFDAFGADRMIWGGLGHSMDEYHKASVLFETMFDFTNDESRVKIRGGNAFRLYRF